MSGNVGINNYEVRYQLLLPFTLFIFDSYGRYSRPHFKVLLRLPWQHRPAAVKLKWYLTEGTFTLCVTYGNQCEMFIFCSHMIIMYMILIQIYIYIMSIFVYVYLWCYSLTRYVCKVSHPFVWPSVMKLDYRLHNPPLRHSWLVTHDLSVGQNKDPGISRWERGSSGANL